MLRYTALGDSITAGESATSPALTYPARIVAMARRSGQPAWGEVLAEPGWTSRALDAAVLDNSPMVLAKSSAISVWIGGDDIAYAGLAMLRGAPKSIVAKSIASYRRDLQLLVQQIQKVSKARIILCTQYNPFPNSPMAESAIAALNAATASTAASTGALIAPTAAWFAGRQNALIAGYRTGRLQDVLTSPTVPIHPNDAGHRVIAEGLAPLLMA